MFFTITLLERGFSPLSMTDFIQQYPTLAAGVLIVLTLSLLLNILSHKKKSAKDFKYKKRGGLFTKHELAFYRSLVSVAASRKLVVFGKVRLADLIEPQKKETWRQAFNRISSKHVDFVLCDPVELKPVLVIELDDSTHDRKDRAQRDQFVDKAFGSAGIPILHTRNANGLAEKISTTMKK